MQLNILFMFKICEVWHKIDMKNVDEATAENVAIRLKWLRNFYGLTQKDFAKSIGILPTQYNMWEKASQRLSLEGALKVNAVYETTLDFLYLGRINALPQNLASALLSNPLDNTSNVSKSSPDSEET